MKQWIKKYRTKIWFALGVNVLLLLGILLLMIPSFETNDDIAICEFANGSRGSFDAHLVYQNYILGLIYRFFYRINGNVPWYTLIQYAFLLAAFTAVTWVILNRLKPIPGLCASLALLLFFGYECYIKIQYTKTAGILAAASMFLLFYAVLEERICPKALLAGFLLGSVGAMYRIVQFVACSALMTGIGFYLLLELKRRKGDKRRRYLLTYFSVFGAMMVLAAGLYLIDTLMYTKDPVWENYIAYNQARTELLDYGFPDENDNRELYQELNLDGEALRLYRSWNFNDPEKFSKTVIEKLIQAKPEQRVDLSLVKQFLKQFSTKIFKTTVFYGFLIILILWLFWGEPRASAILALIYELLFFSILYFYMFYKGRYMINRVDVGLWFSAALVIVWLLSADKGKYCAKTGILYGLMLLIMLQGIWKEDWRLGRYSVYSQRIQSRTAFEEPGRDKEHLYLAKIGTISAADGYGPFDAMPFGIMNNISFLGGWITNSAPCLKTLSDYGIENPYRDMIGNEKVYLIDNDIELTMNYIHTYYDKGAEAVEVRKLGNYTIYQII